MNYWALLTLALLTMPTWAGSTSPPVHDAGLPAELRAHVHALAGEIGERNHWRPQALKRAADYIRSTWSKQGYRVDAHSYQVEAETWSNLEVIRPGTRLPNEIILVGAHYDSVLGSPGANDNGSGVAALLVLSARFATLETARTLRFVAFVNEEPPFFYGYEMGSHIYAGAARGRGDDIRAMFSLETIGYYDDARGSQRYPPLLGFFYPPQGDFIAFVSNLGSRALLKRASAAFRDTTDFPLEQLAAPALVPGVSWSDQLSFWRAGYDGVMITDTALYRYPYYHSAEDTPDKLDYGRFAHVTEGLLGMLRRLDAADTLP